MDSNVDKLWEQVLSQPQQVLKVLPAVTTNPILQILRLFAFRVSLLQQKRQQLIDNCKGLQGTLILAIYRLECFASYYNDKSQLLQKESELVAALKQFKKQIKNEKYHSLIELIVYLKDSKFVSLKTHRLWHLFFLDFIVPDLFPLFSQSQNLPQGYDHSQISGQKTFKFNKINPQKMLDFLSVSLPPILESVLLKSYQLPFSLRHQKMLLLYIDRSLQWIIKKANKLAFFNRSAILGLIKQQKLSFQQQSVLMEAVFRYFYLYHQQRHMKAVQILFQAYNKLQQPARFALSASFASFLERAKKLGKSKMVQAMASKSKWIQQLQQKSSLEQLEPEADDQHQFLYGETIIIKPKEAQRRYFEVIEQYSIGHVNISTNEADFQLQIRRVYDLEGKQIDDSVISLQKTKSFRKRIAFRQAGLYMVNISNSSSWLTSKKIFYRVNLLSPLQLKPALQQKWKQSFYSISSYESLTCNEITYFEKEVLAAIIYISKTEYYSYKIQPTLQSQNLPHLYETDDQSRFLQRIQLLFDAKKSFLFLFKEEGSADKQLISFQDLMSVLQSKQGKRKQKSVVIEIAIKKDK